MSINQTKTKTKDKKHISIKEQILINQCIKIHYLFICIISYSCISCHHLASLILLYCHCIER